MTDLHKRKSRGGAGKSSQTKIRLKKKHPAISSLLSPDERALKPRKKPKTTKSLSDKISKVCEEDITKSTENVLSTYTYAAKNNRPKNEKSLTKQKWKFKKLTTANILHRHSSDSIANVAGDIEDSSGSKDSSILQSPQLNSIPSSDQLLMSKAEITSESSNEKHLEPETRVASLIAVFSAADEKINSCLTEKPTTPNEKLNSKMTARVSNFYSNTLKDMDSTTSISSTLKANAELNSKKSRPEATISAYHMKPIVKTRLDRLNAKKSIFHVASKLRLQAVPKPKLKVHSKPVKGELVLYYDDLCPQSRCCRMLLRMLHYDAELEHVDLSQGKQFEASFRNVNVTHTVPALKHNNLVLTDSHSILMYICETFGGNSLTKQLFPEEKSTRYEIINKLFFNSRILCRRRGDLFTDIVRKGFSAIDNSFHENRIMEAYSIVDSFLVNGAYIVGDSITIADIAIASTIESLNLMFPIDSYSRKYMNLYIWFTMMQNIPHYELNNAGIEKERNIIEHYGKFVFPALSGSTLMLESMASLETFEKSVRLDKKDSKSLLTGSTKKSSTFYDIENNIDTESLNQKLKTKPRCSISFNPQVIKIQESDQLAAKALQE